MDNETNENINNTESNEEDKPLTGFQKAKIRVIDIFAAVVVVFLILYCINNWAVDVTLNGEENVTVAVGETYTDEGAEGNFHGMIFLRNGITLEAEASGEVDTSVAGTYTITYDSHLLWYKGEAVRTVTVTE